jgi:hypothetical protein
MFWILYNNLKRKKSNFKGDLEKKLMTSEKNWKKLRDHSKLKEPWKPNCSDQLLNIIKDYFSLKKWSGLIFCQYFFM